MSRQRHPAIVTKTLNRIQRDCCDLLADGILLRRAESVDMAKSLPDFIRRMRVAVGAAK